MSKQYKRKTVQPPPPLPLHGLDNTIISSRKSYLPQTGLSRTKDILLDFDSSSSESDHAPASPDRLSIDEHQFWQAHVSTTIICPPSIQQPVTFVSYPIKKTQNATITGTRSLSLSLAVQVQSILGSVLEEVDAEIDKDWEASRNALNELLFTSYSSHAFLNKK